MLFPAPGVPVPGGDGCHPPSVGFCTPREQPCSPHLVWGRGITSSAAPWHKSNRKPAASGPEERPAGGKLMGEPSAKSPSGELVGGARALLFTKPVVLFPSHQGKRREEASLAINPPKPPWDFVFRTSWFGTMQWGTAAGDFLGNDIPVSPWNGLGRSLGALCCCASGWSWHGKAFSPGSEQLYLPNWQHWRGMDSLGHPWTVVDSTIEPVGAGTSPPSVVAGICVPHPTPPQMHTSTALGRAEGFIWSRSTEDPTPAPAGKHHLQA